MGNWWGPVVSAESSPTATYVCFPAAYYLFCFHESFDQNVESRAGLTPAVNHHPFYGAPGLNTYQALPSRLLKLTDNMEATTLKN